MKIISLLAVAACLVGCSTATEKCTNVNQDRVYQIFSATYDGAEDNTSVSAQLRFGDGSGTTLEFDGTCAVTHDAYSLSKINLLGTFYTGSGDGVKADHTFTFVDGDGTSYVNSGSIVSIALSSPPSTIDKSDGVTISWTGGAVAADQTVKVYVSSSSSSRDRASSSTTTSISDYTSTVGDTSITLSPTDLSSLTAGSGTLYLRRSMSYTLSQKTEVGGSFNTHYDTAKVTVTVQE